ncbi:MAG: hypothetical protein E6Q96_08385 [Cyclobacteriaceae bacterium]|nr:MAG: hypothetical protein E6Q96_08385 [Cyclobacteriaceae bacterium]
MKKFLVISILAMGSPSVTNATEIANEDAGSSCRQLKRECKEVAREDGSLNSLERHACRAIYHSCKAFEALQN